MRPCSLGKVGRGSKNHQSSLASSRRKQDMRKSWTRQWKRSRVRKGVAEAEARMKAEAEARQEEEEAEARAQAEAEEKASPSKDMQEGQASLQGRSR